MLNEVIFASWCHFLPSAGSMNAYFGPLYETTAIPDLGPNPKLLCRCGRMLQTCCKAHLWALLLGFSASLWLTVEGAWLVDGKEVFWGGGGPRGGRKVGPESSTFLDSKPPWRVFYSSSSARKRIAGLLFYAVVEVLHVHICVQDLYESWIVKPWMG